MSTIQRAFVAEVDLATRHLTPIRGPALDAAVSQGIVCAQTIDWKPETDWLVLAISKTPDNR